ncbi:MAG: heat-inducible transcriptional repressor HrcA [Bacteroidota bacterium]
MAKAMDERKRRILKVITDDYIASAEPVGSRTIARKYNLGLSPATIRNEMADLEEEGYLEQPHTSAGRIPSDRGYRYYVDALMEHRRLRPDETAAIRHELAARERALSSIIHNAAHVLAQLTHYPSLVVSPDRRKALFKHVRLVKLSERNVLILLVMDTGEVEHRIITCEEGLGEAELERLSNILNERLHNRPLSESKASLERELTARMLVGEKLLHQALQALVDSALMDPSEQVAMDGAAQILDQPEFAAREQFRPLLNLLGQEHALYRLLTETCGPEKVRISIGQENREKAVHDCSVITATYEVNDRSLGVIGVLGPTRMDYSKVLAVVEFMATHLTAILNDLAGR